MSVSTSGYDNTDTRGTSDDSGVEKTGTGGGNLPIWEDGRVAKLERLAGTTFTNESSFSIPKGVVEDQNFTTGISTNGEKRAGINATGLPLQPDGKPLSGTAQITAGGGFSYSRTVTGAFQIAAPPPLGVETGENVTGDIYTFHFIPSLNGIAYSDEDIPLEYDAGTFRYGQVRGKVETYDGEPVPNVAVSGSGAVDVSDEDGDYRFLAPGGTSSTILTFYNSYSEDISFASGEDLVKDWIFPKLVIRVVDADFEPVGNTPVKVDDETHYTDDGGRVIIDDPEIGNHSVTLQGIFSAGDLTVAQPDTLYTFNIGHGGSLAGLGGTIGGAKIKVVDKVSGEPIKNATAREENSGAVSRSNDNGVCKILSTEVGSEVEITIGTEGRRYTSTQVTGTLPSNTMLEFTVELERSTAVVNT